MSTPSFPNELCELRFDIPLALTPQGDAAEARGFERAWRAHLRICKMTALATPPAWAVAARFRICGTSARPALGRHLQARLAALPGGPSVVAAADAVQPGWTGVQVWLSFPAADLPALLRRQPPARRPFPRPSSPASPLRGHYR